jgi:hypothetical protein
MRAIRQFSNASLAPQVTPLHLAIVLFEDPEGIGRQAVLKCANKDTLRSIIRVLKKKLVRLPHVSPPPDQASTCSTLQAAPSR